MKKAVIFIAGILIAVNVGVFIFLPNILAPLAIVLSNTITVLLMVVAFLPMNSLLQDAIKKKEDEIFKRKKEEEELREKVSALENKTRTLSSCLNTWGQIASAPMELTYTHEFTIARPAFDNYIVKEAPLEELLEDPKFKPRDPEGLSEWLDKWKDKLFHSKDKSVLYIGRHRAKRSIGINLDKVRFAKDGDKIAVYGASITVLSDEKTDSSADDVSHCWVLNNDRSKKDKKAKVISINTSDMYSDIPEIYAKECIQEAESGFDKQYQLLCEKKTEDFRNLLSKYVPGVVFYDSIEDTSAPWLSLRDSVGDNNLYPVISSISLICNVLSTSGTQN